MDNEIIKTIKLEILKSSLQTNSNASKLSKALAEIQGQVRGIGKDSTGLAGGGARYGYVSGDKLYSTIIPALAKKGILLNTSVYRENSWTEFITTKSGAQKMKASFEGFLHYQFLKDGETIQGIYPIAGDQFDDIAKAMGTALTYSDRYFLLKYFHIATDKDDADAKDAPIATAKPIQKMEIKAKEEPKVKEVKEVKKPAKKTTKKANTKINLTKAKERKKDTVKKEFSPETILKTFVEKIKPDKKQDFVNALKGEMSVIGIKSIKQFTEPQLTEVLKRLEVFSA